MLPRGTASFLTHIPCCRGLAGTLASCVLWLIKFEIASGTEGPVPFERTFAIEPLERCSLSKKPRRSGVEGRREQHSFVMALWLVPEPLTEGSLFAVRYSCSVQVVPD